MTNILSYHFLRCQIIKSNIGICRLKVIPPWLKKVFKIHFKIARKSQFSTILRIRLAHLDKQKQYLINLIWCNCPDLLCKRKKAKQVGNNLKCLRWLIFTSGLFCFGFMALYEKEYCNTSIDLSLINFNKLSNKVYQKLM